MNPQTGLYAGEEDGGVRRQRRTVGVLTSDQSHGKLQVQAGIHDSQHPVLVDITTEGSGGLRVMLNGAVIYDSDPAV